MWFAAAEVNGGDDKLERTLDDINKLGENYLWLRKARQTVFDTIREYILL